MGSVKSRAFSNKTSRGYCYHGTVSFWKFIVFLKVNFVIQTIAICKTALSERFNQRSYTNKN